MKKLFIFFLEKKNSFSPFVLGSPKTQGLPKCTSREERVEKVGHEKNWFSRGTIFVNKACAHIILCYGQRKRFP